MHAKTSLFQSDLCGSKSFQIPSFWNEPFTVPVFKLFSVVPNNFKYRQNAIFTVSVSIFPCSSKSFQMPSKWTIYHPCFQNVLCSSKSFQTSSKWTIYRPCFQNVLCSSKSFQIWSECTIYRQCFNFFSVVRNRFKYRQNTPFTFLFFQEAPSSSRFPLF